MSKQKSDRKHSDEKSSPVLGVTANSNNSAKNDTKHNTDV